MTTPDITEVGWDVRRYIALIRPFVDGRLSADEFEAVYLSLFLNDEKCPPAMYETLNELFIQVDAYCGIPSIRGPRDIDGGQLRTAASDALQQLVTLIESE